MKSNGWMAIFQAAAFCVALAGCSGGGNSNQSELSIVVKVNGTQVGGPLHGDATQSISVASGDEVVFSSATDVSYSLGLTEVEMPVSSHDQRSYQATLTSIAGGHADMVITSSQDSSDRLTVKLDVQPHQFVNRAWSVGETLVEDIFYPERNETRQFMRKVTGHRDTGSYDIQTDVDGTGRYTDTYDADSNHTYLYFEDLSGSDSPADYWCRESPGLLIKSFPMSVGKQWDSEWDAECVFEDTWHHVASNRVVGYEPVTVPAGTFEALHIVSDVSVRLPSGELKYPTRTECWWSVDFQQDVKCDLWELTDGVPTRLFHSVRAVQLAGQSTMAASGVTIRNPGLQRRH